MISKYKKFNNVASFTAKNSLKIFKIAFAAIIFIFTFTFSAYANPDTLCTGKEFNQRVKAFLSGNDRGTKIENTITEFKRGYNPPDDPAYYVDISEDMDGSVIAYTKENDINDRRKKKGEAFYEYTLYWYSDGIVNMNPNAAFMFDKFIRIRNIDLSDFVYLKGLTDTRYMFLECRNLRTVTYKASSSAKEFMPSEMQGMFFGCQSLTNADLTLFNTKMVDNMDELFYKCYNLKNIYVEKERWNIENVRSFTRMFSECHSLRTNEGKKAVDIPEDSYEDYAIPGDDKKEGFIKDVNYQYADYGEYISYVPIDGANYLDAEPETTQAYADELEYDRETGTGKGDGITPYVGDSASGYGAEKQTQQSAKAIIAPTADPNLPNRIIDTAPKEAEQVKLPESSVVESAAGESQITIDTSATNVEVETSNVASGESQDTIESAAGANTEIVEPSDNEIIDETGGRRIMELDEFLKGQEQDEKDGKGEILGALFDNYKFLIFALVISAIVILLLVGMVVYLTKSNMENKDDESHKI